MIIVWGTHHYGKVHGHGAEYLATRFFHVYWFPIIPLESRWVTRQHGDQLLGFDVKLSWRSVTATYLRFWAPLVALGLGATMTIPGVAAAIALLAASGWSWTRRNIRGGRELRRAQLNELAFETACDPLIRLDAQCEALRPAVVARFAEVSGGRTPDDVARFGADTPQQAAFAYASLRLAAAAGGERGRRARASSERILDRLTDREASALADGGPYRATQAAEVTPKDLETAAVAATQERMRAFDEAIAAARGPARTAWDNSPDNPEVKAEIARNKAIGWGNSGLAKVGLFMAVAVFVVFLGHTFYKEHQEAKKALAELRAFTDELCECQTSACVGAVARTRMDDVEELEKTARKGWFTDGDIDDLADRAESCARRAHMATP